MNNEILFTERQRFKQWWLWLILLGVNGLFLYGTIQQLCLGKEFGDKPMSNLGLLLVSGVPILLTVFFYSFGSKQS